MQSVTASSARQGFREVLARAEREPVEIRRHGKTVAVLASPDRFKNALDERRNARSEQALVEAQRLIRHQSMALRLLSAPQDAERLVEEARRVVDRWERDRLCSHHFIDRWRELLSRPIAEMAPEMCGDLDGWGNALRQNSPWSVIA